MTVTRSILAAAAVAALSFVLSFAGTAEAQIPAIERIEPTSGPPGTQVTVVGRPFDAHTTIKLGDADCAIVSRTPGRWVVTIPDGATTGQLVVTNAAGPSTANPTFRVTAAAPPPVIESVTPAAGAPGSEVVLHGHDFSSRVTDNVVTLGTAAVVVRSATPFELRVTVPEGAATGTFSVRVRGAGAANAPAAFTVAVGTTVRDLQPRLGPPGTRVTITGTGFSANVRDDRVTINNLNARVERASTSEIVAVIPNNAANGVLVVDVRNGGRAETPAFAIQLPPSITAVEPTAAPPGTRVVLRGAHFGTDIRIVQAKLGDRDVTVRDITDDTLTVEVPRGTPGGSARFAVTVATLGPAQAPADFTVLTPLAVAAFEPRTGPPGTRVTVTGTGFSPTPSENVVTIANGHAEVVSATGTQLVIVIPAGASGVLDVAVTNNGHARTTGAFVVTHPPFIQAFEPAHLLTGESVTLHGTGFGAQPSLLDVSIGGRRLEIQSVTDTQLVARVPAGVGTGRIVVTLRLQGTTTSATDLVILAPLTIEAVAPREGFPSSVVSLRGTGFDAGTTVVFGGDKSVPATLVSPTQIRALVPQGATTGPLTVRTSDGRTAIATGGDFTVGPVPAGLAITAIEAVCNHPGCEVTLHGYGFDHRIGQNRVTFAGVDARRRRGTVDSLTVQIPAHPGTGLFEVHVGTQTAQSESFTVEVAPPPAPRGAAPGAPPAGPPVAPPAAPHGAAPAAPPAH